MNQRCLRVIVGLLAVIGVLSAHVDAEDRMAFIENEHIRVGVNLKWGGAVTHVSEPGGPNLINSHDLGRQIQQSTIPDRRTISVRARRRQSTGPTSRGTQSRPVTRLITARKCLSTESKVTRSTSRRSRIFGP